LKGRLGGEGGAAGGGKLAVNLASPGKGGLRLGSLEIGQQLVGPAGLGEGLHVVDVILKGLVLVRLAGLVEGLAGFRIFAEEKVKAGLEEESLGPGRGVGIVLEEGGDFLEGFFESLLSLRGFFRGGIGLAGGALGDEVGRLLLHVLLGGGGGNLAVGGDGFGPFGEIIKGAGLEQVCAREVGRLRIRLDEVGRQLGALLVTGAVVGFENLFGGVRGVLRGKGRETRHPRQRQGEQEGLPCRHGAKILRGWGAFGRAEPTRKQPFFPLIPRGLWPNHFPLMILNESAPGGLAA